MLLSNLHWREYIIEGALLGIFMMVASSVVTILAHPNSRLSSVIPPGFFRRGLIGIAMGLTAIALIYSPWGGRSGAHMNPATTLTFMFLGRITIVDGVFYIAAQFIGGLTGMGLARMLLRSRLEHQSVNHVMTLPGSRGKLGALIAEIIIAFLMMTMVLHATSDPALAPYTGLFAGALVATFITLEAPLSGMSLNPARSTASAVSARRFGSLWIYFVAPVIGMGSAAAAFTASYGSDHVGCCKLNHPDNVPCIFECETRGRTPHGQR